MVYLCIQTDERADYSCCEWSNADPESFFQRGSNFFFNESIQIQLKSGHHQPASEGVLLRADDGPTLKAGLVALDPHMK